MDYGSERRGKETRNEHGERMRDNVSRFHEASSGRGTHYIFLSISGRDWPFRFVSRGVQQRKVLANIHTYTHTHTPRSKNI